MHFLRQHLLRLLGHRLLRYLGHRTVARRMALGSGGAGVVDHVGHFLFDGLGELLLEFLGHDAVAYGVGFVGSLRHGVVWFGLVWSGLVWFGLVWVWGWWWFVGVGCVCFGLWMMWLLLVECDGEFVILGRRRGVYIDFVLLLISSQRLNYPWLFVLVTHTIVSRSEAFHYPPELYSTLLFTFLGAKSTTLGLARSGSASAASGPSAQAKSEWTGLSLFSNCSSFHDLFVLAKKASATTGCTYVYV